MEGALDKPGDRLLLLNARPQFLSAGDRQCGGAHLAQWQCSGRGKGLLNFRKY